ncbi:hypothetical protein DMUE_3301 [Dictyocoela muelleri]|nr:hypothetical protein DMUE_3301 [Dictyocoela muelleri]
MFDLLFDEFPSLCPFENTVFTNNKYAYNLLLKCGIVNETLQCPKCNSLLKLCNYSAFNDGFAYKCSNLRCNKILSTKYDSVFGKFTLEFKKIFMGIYSFIFNFHIYQAEHFSDVSKGSYLKLKDLIVSRMAKLQEDDVFIGGENVGPI